jgi:hypothetical protein
VRLQIHTADLPWASTLTTILMIVCRGRKDLSLDKLLNPTHYLLHHRALAHSVVKCACRASIPQQDFSKWALSTPPPQIAEVFYFLICDCQISRISLSLNKKAAVSRQVGITSDSNLLRCLLLIQSHKYVPAIL